jgi:tetratricopeptide (TPR) repeat protein
VASRALPRTAADPATDPTVVGVGARRRPAVLRSVVLAGLALAGAAGCAPSLVAPASAPARAAPDDLERAWTALVDGHSAEAQARFDRVLARDPRDLRAAFGRGTLAFERGDGAAAMDDYVSLLERTAAGEGGAWGDLLAPVAAARAGALLEELDAATLAEARREDRLIGLPRARLPWQAQIELARVGDRVARRRGDPELLDELARRSSCAREIFEIGAAGGLPHLDLEAVMPPSAIAPPQRWRPLLTPGCRISVPSFNGRSGVQVLRSAIAVPTGGYDIVIDFSGEARLRVDDGAFWRHGDDRRYGPRVSRQRVELRAGRHDLEIRVGTSGGRTDLRLWVLPAGAAAPAATSGAGLAKGEPWDALADYARAFVAESLGEADRALAAADALAGRRRFAPGLALAAGIARNDPTRPVGFTRDAARALLRAAVAIDPTLAREWNALADLELDAEHPREAMEPARRATQAAARWWPPELALATALRTRGLEWDADRALDRAAQKGGPVAGAPCAVVEALLRRAEDRHDLRPQERLVDRLAACDPDSGARVDRLRARGDLDGALASLRRSVALDPDRQELRSDLAGVLLAKGEISAARAELAALASSEPYDVPLRVRLADAQAAAGDLTAARRTLAVALERRPDLPDVRRAARALGLSLPLEDFRIDGRQVIRDFQASRRRYAAPAVMLLDRTVHRIFPDGTQLILTHNIVAVQSKDGIEHWGEVTVPSGGEVLMLRTHKRDGSTREPEEIAGKDTVSAADLAVGDYVEWETLESKAPSDAFAPGFLGDRFYFQSFDAPLDRSEYLVITPEGFKLDVDGRAGAPPASATTAPAAVDGGAPVRITTFAARQVPQLFAERSSVPAIEYVPSVRVSSRVSWAGWARFLSEQLYGGWRSSPEIRALAATLSAAARDSAGGLPGRARLAAAVVRWVTDNIEAGDDLRDPASFTLARGRGNRLALVLALSRELGLPAAPVLARSRLVADADALVVPQELDDFGDTLVRFDLGAPGAGAGRGAPASRVAPVYVDLRLRHAPFGYLPPGIEGAKALALDGVASGVALGSGSIDQRTVDMTIHLDERGGGRALATEELTGWPALEWAELLDRFGSDRAKLRQDFEQRWLGVQFPGAHLDDLQVELVPPSSAAPASTPAPRGEGGRVRVRYSFMSPRLGIRSDQEIKLSPTFFRSQPGRRFATEARRSTTLMLGFDVPLRLDATVVLPSTARLVEPANSAAGVVARKGAYRFLEERSARAGSPQVLLLHRESALPLTRVPPSEYAGVAADLRRVDGLEQQEIRIRVRGSVARGSSGAP